MFSTGASLPYVYRWFCATRRARSIKMLASEVKPDVHT